MPGLWHSLSLVGGINRTWSESKLSLSHHFAQGKFMTYMVKKRPGNEGNEGKSIANWWSSLLTYGKQTESESRFLSAGMWSRNCFGDGVLGSLKWGKNLKTETVFCFCICKVGYLHMLNRNSPKISVCSGIICQFYRSLMLKAPYWSNTKSILLRRTDLPASEWQS